MKKSILYLLIGFCCISSSAILAQQNNTSTLNNEAAFISYDQKITGSNLSFKMVPIKAGEFIIGSAGNFNNLLNLARKYYKDPSYVPIQRVDEINTIYINGDDSYVSGLILDDTVLHPENPNPETGIVKKWLILGSPSFIYTKCNE